MKQGLFCGTQICEHEKFEETVECTYCSVAMEFNVSKVI